MKDISDLLKQKKTEAKKTNDEVVQEMYLADVKRLNEFTLPTEGLLWPTPVRPRWKN